MKSKLNVFLTVLAVIIVNILVYALLFALCLAVFLYLKSDDWEVSFIEAISMMNLENFFREIFFRLEFY